METPSVPEPAAFRFRVRLRARWADEDSHGVLNNAVYHTLFEEARHAYFTAIGLMRGSRFPFLLAQTNARYLRPGRGGTEVVVDARTTHVGRTSVTQAYRVCDAASGEAWCEAEARLVFTERPDGGPMEIPAAWRAAIERLERG
jgi:acyl-CoA thioester hydrolase